MKPKGAMFTVSQTMDKKGLPAVAKEPQPDFKLIGKNI